ncbi:MAG: hypothetical protein HC888_02565 [Candidatus Competibacteraceae bacterium]|nr:hypothetical protein [Candidatus Competibacteraceae bacterium]
MTSEDMQYIFKYAFPVPRHGNTRSVELYVASDHNPRLKELREMVEEKKQEAEQTSSWSEAKDWECALYSLDHLYLKELPLLPIAGSLYGCPVYCDTPDGVRNSIQVSLIKPQCVPSSHIAARRV